MTTTTDRLWSSAHSMAAADRLTDCLIIANPAAGNVCDALVEEVRSAVASSTVLTPESSVRVAWTTSPGHAGALAAAAAADLVLTVGGDGTASEVAQALVRSGDPRTVLGTVPAGRGNSTARALWGDRNCAEVLDVLTAGTSRLRVRPMDLMRLREPNLLSILGTSTGFLAQVLLDVDKVDESVLGYDRYLVAALATLADMPDHPTRVTVDGTVLIEGRLSSVAVGGGRFRARSFEFLPESVLDDGLVDVSTIEAVESRALEEISALIPTGGHLGRPEVAYARGRQVVIERLDGEPLVAEYDGSLIAGPGTRLTVEVNPGALRVLTGCDLDE